MSRIDAGFIFLNRNGTLFIHDAPRDCIIQAEDNLHIIFTDGSLYIHIRLVTHLPIRKDDAVLDLGLCNSSFPHIRRNIY